MEKKIELFESGVSITARLPSGKELANYYPANIESSVIVTDSTSSMGIEVSEPSTQQFIEAIDYAKSYKPFISEFEFSVTLKEGFKFKIKREPSKIIRVYEKK